MRSPRVKKHTLPDRTPSCNDIQTTEKVQMISRDAHLLRRISKRQQLVSPRHPTAVSDTDLATMLELSGNISRLLDEISRARNFSKPNRTKLASSRRSGRKHPRTIKHCRLCGTTKTPCWRGDPYDTDILCNVCGLLEAKRGVRKAEEVASFLLDSRWSYCKPSNEQGDSAGSRVS
ncbi:hypothetical protein FDECE_755 [Fusarium decemcellulare]|nr:hypothetical protein FDECE_755 [Fusarium decemcellulare]